MSRLRLVIVPELRLPGCYRTSHDSSAGVSTSQRYLLKWSVPLGHVEVIEYGGDEGVGENGRCPLVHVPESLAVVASAKPSK